MLNRSNIYHKEHNILVCDMGFWNTCINFLVDFSWSNNKERCAFPWIGERETRGRKKLKNLKGRGIATPLIMNKEHSCSWKIHTAFLRCTVILWLMTVVAYRHRTSCSTLSYRYCPSYLCIIISSIVTICYACWF